MTTPPASLAVVIPTFNRADVVTRALGSVLDQAASDVEVIVVDDGSTDHTDVALRSLGDRFVLHRQENQGVCAARNVGAALATASHVAFLDSDDVARPGWIEWLLVARARGADLATCAVEYLELDGTTRVEPPRRLDAAFGGIEALWLSGAFGLSRALFTEVGGFRAGLRFSENTELGLRIGGRHLSRPIVSMATHQPLVSVVRGVRPHDPALQYESSMTLLTEDRAHLERAPDQLATYLAIAGVAAGKLGRRAESRKLLREAIAVRPTVWKNYLRYARSVVR